MNATSIKKKKVETWPPRKKSIPGQHRQRYREIPGQLSGNTKSEKQPSRV